MQKLLNTPLFALYYFARRILLLNSKAGLLAGLTLILFAGLTNPAKAEAGFFKNYVIVDGKYYFTDRNDGKDFTNKPFADVDLGVYDRGSGKLPIGGQANSFNNNGDDVQSTQLWYRVYPQGTSAGTLSTLPFSPLSLGFRDVYFDNSVGSFNKKWDDTETKPNLLANTNNTNGAAGTIYVLEVYFQLRATFNKNGVNGEFDRYDSRNGVNYKATFKVVGTPAAQWKSGQAADAPNNWFVASNWSTGIVPGPDTDVLIPYNQGGSYPNITANGLNANGQFGPAQVRSLTIEGNNGTLGAGNFLRGGEIQIFGNFSDPNNGFNQTGGTFTLAGTGLNGPRQTIDGGSFFEVRMQGAAEKALTKRLVINTSLTFASGSGILITAPGTPFDQNVELKYDPEFNRTASLNGETDISYVRGAVVATGIVTQGFTNTFGNIGIDLTASGGSPGKTIVTRVTGPEGFAYNGQGTSHSIRRGFTFQPDNPNNTNYSLVFHYLTNELNSIPEGNLQLFRSFTGGVPFTNYGKTEANQSANTLTRTFIDGSLAALFTLGDQANPLPVTITSFTAVAEGADAVLNWATATEQNSQGFEVQVSSDAKTYSKLGFVTSTANSSTPRSYQYRDVTAGKAGTRYYRLRQLDLDGKEAFIGPKAVVFGAPTLTSVRAYPNPFGSEINLSLQTIAVGPATVSVIDGVGHQVRAWQPTLAVGASTLTLPGLQNLSKGLYIMQVRYSDGQTQRLKLVKE